MVRSHAIPLTLRKVYSKKSFSEIGASQDKQLFKLDEILDIQVAGNQVIMAVAHTRSSRNTASDHFFRVFYIEPNFQLSVVKHLSLPLNKLSFSRNMKMVVSMREEKIDSEAISQLDRGLIQYNIGAMVVLRSKKKDPQTGRSIFQEEMRFLYFRPEFPSLGSMNLFETPPGYTLNNLGIFFDEFVSQNKQVNFAFIAMQNNTESAAP